MSTPWLTERHGYDPTWKGRDASEKEDGDCIGNKERSAEDKDVIKRCKECLCVV